VINPGTPLSLLEEVLHYVDFVLLMSVNPGFGGQKFIPRSLERLRRLKEMVNAINPKVLIEVDWRHKRRKPFRGGKGWCGHFGGGLGHLCLSGCSSPNEKTEKSSYLFRGAVSLCRSKRLKVKYSSFMYLPFVPS
jgi:hypothetical protein